MNTTTGFDAVELMRKIRDKISAEIEGMTLEEELEWLATQELEDPFLKRLQKKGGPERMTIVLSYACKAGHDLILVTGQSNPDTGLLPQLVRGSRLGAANWEL